MDERLKRQLDFILEIDKEKNIFRQNPTKLGSEALFKVTEGIIRGQIRKGNLPEE